MSAPQTRAGQWLLDRSQWDDGQRAFRVRINATAGPDDMHRHILAIEAEARNTLDEERLARALDRLIVTVGYDYNRGDRPMDPNTPTTRWLRLDAAAIAKAYREDTDATD